MKNKSYNIFSKGGLWFLKTRPDRVKEHLNSFHSNKGQGIRDNYFMSRLSIHLNSLQCSIFQYKVTFCFLWMSRSETFSADSLHFSIIDGNHLECILTRLLCKTSIYLRFCWILTDLVRQAAGISQQRPDIGILVWRILDNIFKKPRHFWLRERIWPMYRYLANLLLEISNYSIEIEWIRV